MGRLHNACIIMTFSIDTIIENIREELDLGEPINPM